MGVPGSEGWGGGGRCRELYGGWIRSEMVVVLVVFVIIVVWIGGFRLRYKTERREGYLTGSCTRKNPDVREVSRTYAFFPTGQQGSDRGRDPWRRS